MATTNFKFQKRQRELAKAKKKEEKKQRKLERNGAQPESGEAAAPDATPSADTPPVTD